MKFILLFVILCCIVDYLQGLECGIDSTASQQDLKQIAENCMKKKVEEKKKPISEDGEEEEELKENTTEKAIKRTKRNDDQKKTTQNSQNGQAKQTDELISSDNNNNNNNSSGKDNCVVQCIFGQMGMTDGNGFPVHHRLSEALLRTAKSRELRDFIQDTTDECFQLMEQGDNQDSCTYSVTLVNCLAERGKSNCADWPIGNLSFLTGKN